MTTTSHAFIGFVPNTSEGMNFLSDLRKLFKDTGMRVIRQGRNPNRKQFYSNEKYGYRQYGHRKHIYCQNLPLNFSTHFGLYVRFVNGNFVRDQSYSIRARTIYETLKKIYEDHGIGLSVVANLVKSGNYFPKK